MAGPFIAVTALRLTTTNKGSKADLIAFAFEKRPTTRAQS
jgi:hypothetical protein